VYFIYSVLLTVGFIALLPKFVIDALRSRKYITGLSQRLGRLPVIASPDYPIVWLHCVSVGETEAARPFVREFLDRFPSYRLVVSTTKGSMANKPPWSSIFQLIGRGQFVVCCTGSNLQRCS